jgi:serine/threonine-protein kinase RsbW
VNESAPSALRAETSEATPGPIVLWLASRYENIELAQAALDHVCRHRGVPSEDGHWIGIALREAVANAIKHGNRQDPGKRVLVSFLGENGELRIVVGDEGAGFDPSNLADPLAPENQMKTSGRGIFYIKTFMDEVTFSRAEGGGTVLTMKKSLKSDKNAKGVE